jgi:hypothetical protein
LRRLLLLFALIATPSAARADIAVLGGNAYVVTGADVVSLPGPNGELTATLYADVAVGGPEAALNPAFFKGPPVLALPEPSSLALSGVAVPLLALTRLRRRR